MSDPSNTDNELDQYGVWVKKEVQSEKGAGLPAADGDSPSADSPEEDSLEETSEISIDDFFSSDDAPKAASSDAGGGSETSAAGFDAAGAEDGEISLDSFFDEGGDSPLSAEVHTEETEIEDEEPLDIDLEFDDSVDVPLEEEGAEELDFDLDTITDEGAGSSGASDDGMESVDFSDFFSDSNDSPAGGIPEKIGGAGPTDGGKADGGDSGSFDSIFSTMGSGDSGTKAAQTASEDETESVDLSAFDGGAADTSGSEEIDLSDFGIDGSDDSMGGVKNSADAEEEEDEDIKTNFDISVSADDDIGGDSEESNAGDVTDEEVSIVQDSKQPERHTEEKAPSAGGSQDDDFDVDSLLSSIEDESGAAVSIDDALPAPAPLAESGDPPAEKPEAPEADGLPEEPLEAAAQERGGDLPQVPEVPVGSGPAEGGAEGLRSLPPQEAAADAGEEADDDAGETFIPVPIPVSEETGAETEESLARNEEIDYSDGNNTNDDIDTTEGKAEVDEEAMDGINEILKQIADEVSSLKQEIKGLRDEVDVIKKNVEISADAEEHDSAGATSQTEPSAVSRDEDDLIPVPDSGDAESNFFKSDEELDDVALDGSELNNIIGNAQLSEESVAPIQAEEDEDFVRPAQDESGSDMDRALSEPLPPPEESNNDELMNDDVALSADELGGIFSTADVTEESGSAAADGEPAEEAEPAEEIAEEPAEEAAIEEAAEEPEAALETEEELSVPIVEEEEPATPADAEEAAPIEIADETLEEVPAPEGDGNAEETIEEAVEEEAAPIDVGTDGSEASAQSEDTPADTSTEPAQDSEAEPAALFEEEAAEQNEPSPLPAAEEAAGEAGELSESDEPAQTIPLEAAGDDSGDVSRAIPEQGLAAEDEPPLTEENISYLESEEAPALAEEAPDEASDLEDEELEDEINGEPVEEVFNDWNEASAEGTDGGDGGTAPLEAETTLSDGTDGSDAAESDTRAADILAVSPADDDFEEAESEAEEEAELAAEAADAASIPENMKEEIKSVLSYMDQLLESLPEDKISQFAKSEEFNTYKKLFKELGLA